MRLLTVENAKTSKGEQAGYMTGIIYMLPDTRTCPFANKAGCLQSCLVTAGLAGIYKSINETRQARKELFYNNRKAFFQQLEQEIDAFIKKANKAGMTPIIRLNGTSDIAYERYIVRDNKNIFQLFPTIQFYDYTKNIKRINLGIPNYDVTFSYSGTDEYKPYVTEALNKQARMAIVFRGELPKTYMNKIVIDGDKNDLRFLEPKNVIIGLKAKGKAKTDDSKFIVTVV